MGNTDMGNDVTYSMRGKAVVISRPFREDAILDERNPHIAIGNIKRNRAQYATEEAWRKGLATYEGALEFMLSRRARARQ